MASFLSMVYKRQSSAPASFHTTIEQQQEDRRLAAATHLSASEDSDDVDGRCLVFHPPGVTASGSSETPWAPAISSSRSEDDASLMLSNTQREEEEEGRRFIMTPFTPEGILPRPSVDRMRQDLQVHPRLLERSLRRLRTTSGCSSRDALPGVAKFLSQTASNNKNMTTCGTAMSKTTSFLLQEDRKPWSNRNLDPLLWSPQRDTGILPPPPPRMTEEEEGHSPRPLLSDCESSVLSSPQVSTSSFYARRHNNHNVAMSPVLQVGQARTAVGALVALREAGRHQNFHDQPSTRSSSLLPSFNQDVTVKGEIQQQQPPSPAQHHSLGALPAFRKEMLEALVVTNEGVEMPCDKLINTNRDKYDVALDESENLPYQYQRLSDASPRNASSGPSALRQHTANDAEEEETIESSSVRYISPSSFVVQSRAAKDPVLVDTISDDNFEEASLLDEDRGMLSASSSSSFLRPMDSFRSRTSSKTSLISMNIQEQVTKDEQEEDKVPEKDLLPEVKAPNTTEATSPSNDNHGYDLEESFDGALMRRKFQNQQLQKQMKQMNQKMSCEDEEDDEDPSDFQAKLKAELARCQAIVNVVDHEAEYSDDDDDLYYESEEEYDDGYCEEENVELVYDADRGLDASILHDEADDKLTFEDALQRRKVRNQRQQSELLLLQVLARLRDDLGLVEDLEAAVNAAVTSLGGWFVKTPMDEPNLMTGFSEEDRQTILHKIDMILKELDDAQPEEFFLSPSQVPALAVRHDDLHQALIFFRAMVNTAIPAAEREGVDSSCGVDQKPRFVWKSLPELRSALGIVPPESPTTVRGGDTSLFSLPGESGADTPHTSNVSMGTSITSVNPFSPRHRAHMVIPQLILPQDGLQMRHTIQSISSLAQKISIACQHLRALDEDKPTEAKEKTHAFVEACDEIKQCYLQLLAIPKEDSKAVMEAFRLELLTSRNSTPSITREVSADADEHPPVFEVRQQHRYTYGYASENLQVVKEGAARRITSDTSRASSSPSRQQERANLFSPSTQDMRSRSTGRVEAGALYTCDDLRRQIGSFDRADGDDERRDGPPNDFELREGTEEWERMYQNVVLAASSIRSEASASN